jgi:hypothetical protein
LYISNTHILIQALYSVPPNGFGKIKSRRERLEEGEKWKKRKWKKRWCVIVWKLHCSFTFLRLLFILSVNIKFIKGRKE